MWMVKQWEWPQRKRRALSLHYNSCVSLLSITQVWNNTDAIDVTSASSQTEREWSSLWDKFPDRFLIYINNECFSWYCMLSKRSYLRLSLIEEHLVAFLINKLPACSLWLTLKRYPTSSLFGESSISILVKMMLISSITATLIFQRRTAFCTRTCLPDMPISF